MRRFQIWLAFALVTGQTAVALARPPHPTARTLDEEVFRVTLAEMRDGAGYYQAMDAGLGEVYGPPVAARDVRLPTAFWLWSWLPGERAHWPAFAIWAGLAGAVAALASSVPLGGAAVTYVILRMGVAGPPGAQVAQVLTVEFWTALLVFAFVLAWRRRWEPVAVLLAFAAAAVREHAAALIAGAGLASLEHRKLRPWVGAAAVAAVGAYAANVSAVTPYLAQNGYHTALALGGAPVDGFVAMAGFGFSPPVVGVLVWALACVRAATSDLRWVVTPFLAIPVLDFLIDRPYWGAMVVPLAVVLALELINEVLARSWPRRRLQEGAGWSE